MRQSRGIALVVILLIAVGVNVAIARDGVKIGNPSYLRNLVSAEKLENTASLQYTDLTNQASKNDALRGDDDVQVKRLRRIAADLLPFTEKFNARAKDWKWEINLISSKQINAFCMPGGKIAFFTGILDQLRLNDDEVAMIMGHEIAHALREHARERAAKSMLTNVGAIAVAVIVGGNVGELARVGGGLLSLKFSRDDESEADLIGMELAARAGYDPRAGISLWKKMAEAGKRTPPAWFSTHPSGPSRIKYIETNLPDVLPLYETAKRSKAG